MTTPMIQLLVIEDSQVDVLLLDEVLSRNPSNLFALTVVERLSAGLEALHRGNFDLVLLDLGLPDSQGLETFQTLHLAFPEIPVVILTGLSNERTALAAVQSGAQDYLVKGSLSWENASRAIRYAIERQQAQAALRETNEMLQALIQASPIGIVVFDSQGIVKLWSLANERIFGWNESETVGKELPYIPQDKREEHRRLRQRVLQGEAFMGIEVRRQRKDGSPVDLSISTAPLRDGEGNIIGIMGLNTDITERKRAEESMRASETKYRKLFDEMSNGCALHQIVCDDAGNPIDYATLDVNAAFETLMGVKREQVVGEKASEILPPEELKGWLATFGPTALTGASTHYEIYSPMNERCFEGVAFSVEPGKFAVTFNDVTERKRVEQALRDSEARYRLATQATNDIIWEWDPKTRQLVWSENAQLVFGYSPEEVGPNDTWWDDHIHPEDRECLIEKLNAFIDGSETLWSEEYRFLLKDGSYAHISDHAYIERDGAGKAIRMVGAMSNITEQKRAEEAVRDSERRYRSLFEDSPISLWLEDFSEVKKRLDSLSQAGINDFGAYFKDHPQFVRDCASLVKIMDVNKATIDLYQAKEKKELFKNLSSIFGNESYDEFAEELLHILKGDTQFGWEGTNQTVKGERLNVSLTWSVVPGHEDDLARVIVSITDVTKRKRAEEALRESEERFRTLINQVSHIAIQGYGPDGTVRFWNEASEEIYGYSAEEAMGKNLLDLIIPPEMHTEVRQAIKNMVENGEAIPSAELLLLHKDGSRVPVYSNHTMIETSGYGKEFFCIDIDLTERKQAEEATQRRNAELTVLNQIGQTLSKLAEPSEIFEAIFTGIGQVLDNRNLYIALYDQTNQYISFPVYTMQGEHRTGVDRPFSNGITEYIIHTNTPLLIKQDLAETLNECGINMIGVRSRSFLAVPMHVGDKVIGVIALQDYDLENVYDEHHVELLTTIAAQATVALENSRLYNEVQQELAERKRAEEALRQSNELLSLFIKQSPIFAYIKEVTPAESRVLRASENFQDMIGIPGSLMDGKSMGELFPPEFAAKITEDDWAVVSGDQVLKLDEDLNGRNYTTIKFPIAQGTKNLLAGYTIDITERRQAEKALQESEERFRGLYNNATIGLYRTTPDGRILLCNPAAVRLLGFESFEELTKRNLEEDGFEPDYPRREFREKMERDGQVIGLESIWTKKDGTPIFVRESATAVRDSQGNILYYDGTFEDITLHKQAEKALRESEEKYRLLFENAPVGVYQSTPEGRYISVNPAMAAIYLYQSPEEMIAQVTDIARQIHVDPAERQSFKSLLAQNGEVREFVTQNYRRDGSIIWTSTNARVVKDDSGNVLYYEGFLADVTSRKQAEETIRLSEKKFKTLFEIAPVGISVLDREHNIIDTNYALQRITGLRKNELVNGAFRKRTYLRPDGSVMPPEEYASTRALKEDMPIFDVETGIVTKDRGVVWTQISAAPLNMPDTSLVVVTQDISERKLSEQMLHQRLAELETLYESGLSLSQLLEPKEIGQKIIDVLAEKLDWYHTTVRMYHPDSNSLELLAYNIAGITSDRERQEIGERFKKLIARPGDGLSGWSLQHSETVRCGDTVRDPRYIETVPGLRSGLYVPIKINGRAIGVISVESEKPGYFTAEDEHLAVTLAAQAAVALENIRLFKDLQKSNQDLSLAYDETIAGWSHALDLRDKETEGHTQRVTTLTEHLAHAMGISDTNIVHIRRGALLHDIGKMGVPDRILLKPDKLTEEEWIIMRQHPVHAFNLLSKIEFLHPALNIPHYHHERWNGSGYPEGRKGEQIPLEARIFAVVDVYDALISDRPYRPAWPNDKAIQYIREQAGVFFDPQVVEVFMELIKIK